jgi:alkanesulfonate monooxygenase SsuD/methylene tetrahydromethanopterin reductase-like flavin-dependent oxidoreductase (luciferase family)
MRLSPIRLGLMLVPTRAWAETAEEFRWAEDVGYDVAYIYDHLTHPTAAGQWLAHGFTTLTAAASVTTTMDLGTLVASATLHSPVMLARIAATVDDVSGGRLVLGLGAGSPLCAAADRGETPTPGEMSRRLADVVTGFDAVFDGATEWEGATTTFSGLETTPVPAGAHRPYLMLAAHGPKAMSLAARHADGWNTYGGPAAVALAADEFWSEVGRQAARLDEACAAADRDPAELRRSLLLGYGEVRPTSSVAAYEDAVERAAALGFDEVVVYGPHGPGDRFSSDPAVHVRALERLKG